MPDLDLTATSVDLTRAICDVPSVSDDETVLADAIHLALAEHGHLDLHRDGDTIVARTHLGRDRRVVIAGHIDTVPINQNVPTRDIEIDAPPGKIIALLGPTGSGKSTVVNLLPRFYDVTQGSISIDGVDIRNFQLESLRANIGSVQQDVFLFLGTIRDNIAVALVNINI